MTQRLIKIKVDLTLAWNRPEENHGSETDDIDLVIQERDLTASYLINMQRMRKLQKKHTSRVQKIHQELRVMDTSDASGRVSGRGRDGRVCGWEAPVTEP